MSQPALNKIAHNSPSRQHPSELETSIATALYELETNIPDLKSALRPLQFVSAREVCPWQIEKKNSSRKGGDEGNPMIKD